MRRLLVGIGFVCLACSTAMGQYFQYSQYNFTPTRINPAMTGLTRYASATTVYRHQETGGGLSINSNFVNLTYPLLQSSTGRPWSGIALSLHNDQSAAIFKTQEASLTYAVHIQLSRFQTLSFGAKALFQSRKVGLDGFYTGSQYIQDRGFDLTQSSGENFSELRNSFKTFSAGFYWQEVDKKGRTLKQVGASLYDFNKPKDSFLGSVSQLPGTFVVHAAAETYSQGTFHLIPEGLFTFSGGTSMLNAGLRFQKELNVQAKKPSDLVDVMLRYAVRRSAIAGIQLHREKLSVGISYDFPLFYKNPSNIGTIEFGIELRSLVSTRAQKQVAKRRKAAEERQQQLSLRQKPKTDSTRTPGPAVVAKVDSIPAPLPEVVIEKSQEQVTPSAQAGQLKQEPMIVERVTLHFPFEFNSAELDDTTENFLDELAATLLQDENLKMNIEGHTDNIGSDKFNLRLSHKRAEVVRQHMIKKGIAPERLSAEGKGLREPITDNLTEENRAKNRRVEITVYY